MIKKKLVAITGEYTTQQGETKKRYLTVGHLHEGQYGDYVTLDPLVNLAAIPLKPNDNRVYLNLYDPDPPRDQQGQAPAQARQPQNPQQYPPQYPPQQPGPDRAAQRQAENNFAAPGGNPYPPQQPAQPPQNQQAPNPEPNDDIPF